MLRLAFAWLVLLGLTSGSARAGSGDAPTRHLPAECASAAQALDVPAERREREWNRSYREAFTAIEAGDLDTALGATCTALALSAELPARDWRFAETLDELGLVHYRRGDLELSARAQGMAATEILLAKGPEAPEVATYVARLALPLAALGRNELAAALASQPHRLVLEEFLPIDAALADRLDWVIAEYLRLENLTAAAELQALVDRIEVD